MKDTSRKEIIEKMCEVHGSISKNLEEGRQIDSISYYKDLKLGKTKIGVENALLVKIKDDNFPEVEEADLSTYEIYDADNNLVATVDKNGKIHLEENYFEEFEEYIKNLNLEENSFELPEELSRDDFTLLKEGLEETINNKKIEEISKIISSDEINSYSEVKTDQKTVFEKLTNKQELDPNTRVTQTETLADMIPELKEKEIVKIGVVYSDYSKGQNGRFSFVGIDKDGKIQTIDSLENTQGTTTGQKITSINSNDGKVEQEQVAGMVRINGRNGVNGREELLSVRQGQYGILEVDYVRAELSEDKGQRYLSAPIETQNIWPTTREIRDFMDKSKNPDMGDELDRAKKELEVKDSTNIKNIDDIEEDDQRTP